MGAVSTDNYTSPFTGKRRYLLKYNTQPLPPQVHSFNTHLLNTYYLSCMYYVRLLSTQCVRPDMFVKDSGHDAFCQGPCSWEYCAYHVQSSTAQWTRQLKAHIPVKVKRSFSSDPRASAARETFNGVLQEVSWHCTKGHLFATLTLTKKPFFLPKGVE